MDWATRGEHPGYLIVDCGGRFGDGFVGLVCCGFGLGIAESAILCFVMDCLC
jgi:hypothetical protein